MTSLSLLHAETYALARPDCTCTVRSECSITRRNAPMLPSFRSLVSHHPTQEKVKTDSHASVMPLGRMTRVSQVLGWCAIITGGVGSFDGEPFDIMKTLAQTNKEKSLPLTGLVKQIYAAFYRGVVEVNIMRACVVFNATTNKTLTCHMAPVIRWNSMAPVMRWSSIAPVIRWKPLSSVACMYFSRWMGFRT
jgi:hypothetical protein